MQSIEYLIKENRQQYDEITSLNEKIKNLEDEIKNIDIF